MPLRTNDVFRVPIADGVVARIRVQCGYNHDTTFRAEPDKGDADEAVALAAVKVLTEYFEASRRDIRVYFRRYRSVPGKFTDVLDAVTVHDQLVAHDPTVALRDLQLIASSSVH